MLVDKQSELMSDLLFTVHQHGGDDITWKPPITLEDKHETFIAAVKKWEMLTSSHHSENERQWKKGIQEHKRHLKRVTGN